MVLTCGSVGVAVLACIFRSRVLGPWAKKGDRVHRALASEKRSIVGCPSADTFSRIFLCTRCKRQVPNTTLPTLFPSRVPVHSPGHAICVLRTRVYRHVARSRKHKTTTHGIAHRLSKLSRPISHFSTF